MKSLWQFILDGRFSEGCHNLAATCGLVAMIYVYLMDAQVHHEFNGWKTSVFAALVCGIPIAKDAYVKWLRAPDAPAGAQQ